MNILHVADTHLGYSAYRKVNNDGFNQREIDVYNAFEQFIDYAVNTKPDLILHAGDLFDSVRPNNRAITFAIDQILRLSKIDIPLVMIAGNHEHPKLKETGNIFSIFDHIKSVFPVYKSSYEKLIFDIDGYKLTVHAVPQMTSKVDYNLNLEKIKKDTISDYNVLLTHGCVRGIKEFSMNEFNELLLAKKYIDSFFDYVALGHYHKFTKVGSNAFYSGSTECFTFSDANVKKGFIELKFKNGKIKHNFINLDIRKVVDLQPIDCSNINLNELMNAISKVIDDLKPNNKVFRLILKDIKPHVYRGIDFGFIRRKCSGAVHYELKPITIPGDNAMDNNDSKINSLSNEFSSFIKNQDVVNKDVILKLGLNYINKIESIDEK